MVGKEGGALEGSKAVEVEVIVGEGEPTIRYKSMKGNLRVCQVIRGSRDT